MSDAQINAVTDKLMGIDLSKHSLKVLTMSTSMIPKSTVEAIDSDDFPLWVMSWGDVGWIIPLGMSLPSTMISWRRQHKALLDLMTFAESRGYDILRLHADDDPLPRECGLPMFGW